MNITFGRILVENIWAGSIETIRDAWIVSRPNDLQPDLDKILAMDVPVNEFMQLNFVAEAPILVREALCSLRNHVVWARSSRVDDLKNWVVYGPEELRERYQQLHSRMAFEMNCLHQDDFRRHIPLGYITKFSFSLSFRDTVRLVLALNATSFSAFIDFANQLVDSIKYPRVRKAVEAALTQRFYKPLEFCPRPETIATGKIGDFHVVSRMIPLSLRAQLVRHRAIMVHDEISTLFNEESLGCSMEHLIMSQIALSNSFAEELLRKRSCWIAQSDLWEGLLSQLRKNFGERNFLPCEDGKCRFTQDNNLRKQGRDPSPPCPVAARLSGEKMSLEHSRAALEYASRRPNPQFWLSEIKNVEV